MPNRLILEKSPYLRQHGDNPVDWYPWGEEAFAAAADLNRPVFLSIGYSSCHWCHVMERESFRDPGTALLLNRDFIAIKVDREERPDIDAHYLAVCQLLTGSAGWPLSIFLTPDRRAFFAGTYFPRERRFGLAGFNDLLERIARAWKVNPREVLDSARRIAAAARETGDSSPRATPGPELLDRAFGRLSEEFDPVHGGFGGAPKFPQPHRLLFLLRYAQRTDDRRALEIVGKTLRAMRRGGIFDQLGFGFHRYATDAGWSLPHFEKMLCDQALLIMAYTEAFQATGRREFGKTAEETIAYVLRELVSVEGGFLTAEDADSEGEEGRYYLWDAAEVRASLGPAEAEFAARVFGLEAGEGAGPGSPAGGGRRVLRLVRSPETEGRRMGMSPDEAAARWEALRARLLAVRERRPRPFKDGKVLTDWNGLMIAALAKAARALDRAEPAGAAVRAAAFIKDGLCPGGMLRHRYADGEAAVTALLDDHAFLIWGLIELYETVYDPAALAWALRLTDAALEGFWDDAGGGFFQTHRESRDLPWRRKESYDGAVPSGNSAMLANLLRLGRLTGRAELEEAAGRLAGALAGTVVRAPEAHALFLCGLDLALSPSREVVVIGGRDDPRTRRLLEPLRREFLPRDSVIFCPADEPAAPILELVPHARAMSAVEGRPTAYVCSGSKCDPPTTDPRALRRPARQRGTGFP